MKSTPKRIALLEILDDEWVYLSPEDIWHRMKKRFRSIGLPTVYRNLEELPDGQCWWTIRANHLRLDGSFAEERLADLLAEEVGL